MHDPRPVEVCRAPEQHLGVPLGLVLPQRRRLLPPPRDDLGEVRGHELEDEDEAGALREQLVQADHVGGVEGLLCRQKK